MSKLDNGKIIIICVGIIMLGAIELMAIHNQMNGTSLSVIVGGITLIIGYGFGIYKRGKEPSTDTEKV